MVAHPREGRGVAQTQDTAQLLTDRKALLLRQNHAGMLSPGADHGDTARTQGGCQVAVHRVLIDVDLYLAHGCRSAGILPFKGICRLRLGFDVCVDLGLIGVVAGQGGMNLC